MSPTDLTSEEPPAPGGPPTASLWTSKEGWVAVAVAGLLLWWGWPEGADAVLYPDTRDYLAWPEPMSVGKGVGERIFGYPLLLRGFGHGAGIVALQVALWLVGFASLGFALARVPGMLLLGLVGLAPTIAWWNVAVLTESLTLSLGALLLALGIVFARGESRLPFFIAWGVACITFGFLRPGNLLVLPFLLVPFARHRGARLAAVCVIAALVFAVGFAQTQRSALWRINYYTAFMTRVFPSPEASHYFEARGMPSQPLRANKDAFFEWFNENGGRVYPVWVATRASSYSEAWAWLAKDDEGRVLREKYFARQERHANALTPIAQAAFDATALPQWLWAGLVVLAPLVDWRRKGAPGLLSLWAVALAVGTYGQAFVSYNGSGSGHMRHLLLASLLYRGTWMIAACSIYSAVRESPRGQEESAARPA